YISFKINDNNYWLIPKNPRTNSTNFNDVNIQKQGFMMQ
ncbi:MAG: hypothetical protein ACI952_002249, partial [Flavobacteriales bacterium]